MHVRKSRFTLTALLSLGAVLILLAAPLRAAEREKVEAFLEVTGFDVALESIRLGADAAPGMLGLEAEDFGSEWKRLVREVFATDVMLAMATDILVETLSDENLAHAADFYASDLGQRLVEVENRSHMEEDEALKRETGRALIEAMTQAQAPRLAILERLNGAIGSEEASIRAIQEVQVRFLTAAAAAGVIELRMEEPDLREALRADEDELRDSLREGAMANAAYTYQPFSDAEMIAYAEALEQPKMQAVYELLNAVQFEITANRYEAVADRLAAMQPSQDL